MSDHHGGCLCGKVQYTFKDAVMTALCHCKTCQKQSGSAFSVNVAVRRDGLTVTGETGTYRGIGDSGAEVIRHFCADCGSPLFTFAASAPALAFVKLGTLDDAETFTPSMQIWKQSALPWSQVETPLRSFDHAPAATR